MPVFHKVQDNTLVVTVDGDFTPDEFERKVGNALNTEDLAARVGVLLDVSGAAGSHASGIVGMARVFVEHHARVIRIAVLGSAVETEANGVEIEGFNSRADALEWLNG